LSKCTNPIFFFSTIYNNNNNNRKRCDDVLTETDGEGNKFNVFFPHDISPLIQTPECEISFAQNKIRKKNERKVSVFVLSMEA
jgi:hypothetical protein